MAGIKGGCHARMSGAAMTKSYSRRDFPRVALAAGVLPILPAAVHAASPCSEASRRRRPARQVSRGHRPICPRRKREHHYNLWLRSGDQHPGIEGHLVPDHGGVGDWHSTEEASLRRHRCIECSLRHGVQERARGSLEHQPTAGRHPTRDSRDQACSLCQVCDARGPSAAQGSILVEAVETQCGSVPALKADRKR